MASVEFKFKNGDSEEISIFLNHPMSSYVLHQYFSWFVVVSYRMMLMTSQRNYHASNAQAYWKMVGLAICHFPEK